MNFMPNMANMQGMPNMANMQGMRNMANMQNMPNATMPNGVMPNGVMPNGVMPNGAMPNAAMSNFKMPIMNPRSINRQNKDMTINRNIYMSGYGVYQMCPTRASIRVKYRKDFNRGSTKSVCKVVVYHMHAIDIVDGLTGKGLTELKSNNPIPAVINPMYREFNGNNTKSDDATADENMILRTNFAFIAKRQENLFPVTSDSEVVYSNPVTVIRTPIYAEIPHENLYKMGVITVMPQRPDLITSVKEVDNKHDKHDKHDKRDKHDKHDKHDKLEKIKQLSSKDLFKLQAQLETAFQVAAMGGHSAVIITLFDQEYGIPIDDQIFIYNYCILKYGHFFNAVIFGIPPYQPADLVDYIDEIIVKPQNIAADIEMKATADMMNNKFVKTKFGDDNENDEEDADAENADDSEPDTSNMTSSEKIEYMKKKIKNKRIQLKAQAKKARAKQEKKTKHKSRRD